MIHGSFDEDIAVERILTNSALAESYFEAFKKKYKLPADAAVTDVACQRKMKIGDGPGGKQFNPYHGLTIAIFLPQELIRLISIDINHFRQKLTESGPDNAFLFLPADTFHITLTGIIERLDPKIDTDEVLYYSRLIAKANLQLPVEESSFQISIGNMKLYDQFFIYLNVDFDRIPNLTLAALTSQIGERILHTGKFHLTLGYLTRDLTDSEQVDVTALLEQFASSLQERELAFTTRHAGLYAFDSMVSYTHITGSNIRLV